MNEIFTSRNDGEDIGGNSLKIETEVNKIRTAYEERREIGQVEEKFQKAFVLQCVSKWNREETAKNEYAIAKRNGGKIKSQAAQKDARHFERIDVAKVGIVNDEEEQPANGVQQHYDRETFQQGQCVRVGIDRHRGFVTALPGEVSGNCL